MWVRVKTKPPGTARFSRWFDFGTPIFHPLPCATSRSNEGSSGSVGSPLVKTPVPHVGEKHSVLLGLPRKVLCTTAAGFSTLHTFWLGNSMKSMGGRALVPWFRVGVWGSQGKRLRGKENRKAETDKKKTPYVVPSASPFPAPPKVAQPKKSRASWRIGLLI